MWTSKRYITNIFIIVLMFSLFAVSESRWSEGQAKQWYEKYTWGAGFNYAPSYAVN